ncbi:LOW QUALITY PROTEIN: hypothetical protein BJ085DRAFT_43494 [Dimargaris cristalligena]|uniref:P-type ATPase A domain-containing protein n=1 Tax=Dimargaris cristalligena TaxID=215637 RepID=A0A4Q0A245_9FUNG|nr:LOW QUALITY PROTEIN: hypothetical protein BJ085DRAFT_43494 [Dimargaris cristalligena]|eukprot:RKP40173.1 LOW QUALITY PROTEIN: hypothetical protein BJ085DRAFT_43494 [Dimargaris cristalligena]
MRSRASLLPWVLWTLYDLDGNQCPLYPKRDVVCPLVCVTDLSECPRLLQPNCPNGKQFCLDSTCADQCPKDLPNPCLCGETSYRDSGEMVIPCRKSPTIDIPHYNMRNGTAQTQGACLKALNTTSRILNYGAKPTDPTPPKRPPPGFTYVEPIWLALWTMLGLEAMVLTGWTLYKQWREKAQRRGVGVAVGGTTADPLAKETADSELSSVEGLDRENYKLTAYRTSLYGNFAAYSLVAISLSLVVYMFLIIADYYGALLAFALTHQTSALSSQLFIISWYLMVAWFITLNITRHRLRNFFRIQTRPAEGHFIQVEQQLAPLILLDDNSVILRHIRRIETSIKSLVGWHVHVTTTRIEKTAHGRRYFTYQCTRYVYDSVHGRFAPFGFQVGTTGAELLKQQSGILQGEADRRIELLGSNFITVAVPSLFNAILQEFTGFFYLYQLTILLLFYYYAYYEIGLVDTGVVLISAFVKVAIRLQSEKRLKSMAEHEILRDQTWRTTTTADLVPGDVYQIDVDQVVPADSVVLSGNIVADESSLTGEPLPIRKFPVSLDMTDFDLHTTGKTNALFAGTTISQAQLELHSSRCTALVYRTGTATDKGQLVRKILFPSPVSFVFDEQLKIVMMILALEGLFMFGLSLWLQQQNINASWFNGMFCLAQIISPILPAALVVGQSVASTRLRKQQIYCVDLPRIMVAGKTQIFCFDKTGTLTKEGLDFYGVQCVRPTLEVPPRFDNRTEDFPGVPRLMRLAMASCHAVTELNNRLIGNPVDIEMFRATGWDLCHPDNPDCLDMAVTANERLLVLRRFEFVHARMSMSVAVLDTSTHHVHIFVKGSFEKVRDMSDPGGRPADYDRVTSQLAREGCYVLAVAHRDLGPVDPDLIRTWSREDFESHVVLLGLILFKNNLKTDTADAMAELKQGSTRTVMITGDTALTGVYIAQACGMTPSGDRMLLGDIEMDNPPPDGRPSDEDGPAETAYEVVWRDVDTHEVVDVNRALLASGLELAVTGRAFNALVERDLIREYLLNIRVFARMTPQDKVACVQLHMERGITAMCGDGGNDCGALRVAHVGIALSEAEASIVSPFSTSVRSIYSCVELLRQGRAALATSFAGYKYLILYGQTMAMLKANFFYFQGSIAQSLWIFVDAFITMGMTACLALTPQRPTARLLGIETLTSTVGIVLINWLFLVGGYLWLYQQTWFRCHEFDARGIDIAKCAYLAFLTMFQFINNGAIFNFGYQFRQACLVAVWAAFIAMMSYVELADPNRLGCLFRLNCGNPKELGFPRPTFDIEPYNIDQGHNVFPRIANMAVGLLWERAVVLGPLRTLLRRLYPQSRLQLKL